MLEQQAMTNSDFLSEVLGHLEAGQFGWITSFRHDPGSCPPASWAGRAYTFNKAQAAVIDKAGLDNTYFCTSVLKKTEQGNVRRKESFVRLAALVIDDVTPDEIKGFSWSLQTSPGNFQVGILLDAQDPDTNNKQLIDRVMSSLAARGRTNDASGNAIVRYVRLPIGTNTKPRAAGAWSVKLDVWAPRVRWSLADACEAIGIDLDGLRARVDVHSPPSKGTGTHAAAELIQGITGPINERAYHDSIIRLSASLIAGGMFAGAAVEFMYSLMDASKPVGNEEELRRWQIRRDEIPRAIKTAEKFAPVERAPTLITVNLNSRSPDEPSSPHEPVRMDWEQLASSPPEPAKFRLDGWLPERTVTLLSANGGVGKSNLSLQLAVALTTGQDFLNIQTKQSKVLVISAEDEARTVHFRVANVCQESGITTQELTPLSVYDLTQHDCVMWKDGRATDRMQWLADKVVQHKADVVIIDNASDVFIANENDRAEVRGFMRCLNMIAVGTNAAVLVLAHVDKASVRTTAGSDSNTTFSGSTAWNNSARSRWAMVKSADDAEIILRHEKSNLGPLQQPIALAFDLTSKTLKLFGTTPGLQLAASVVHNAKRAAILKMIAQELSNDNNLSMNANANNNIYKILNGDPLYPPRLKRKDFFVILRELEIENLIGHESYAKANRTKAYRVILTKAGQARVAVGSGAPPNWVQREEE